MKDSVVDVDNEFLYLAGTAKRVVVSARGPLGNIPSMYYVPVNSISVIRTNVLNRLGFSCEINHQKERFFRATKVSMKTLFLYC